MHRFSSAVAVGATTLLLSACGDTSAPPPPTTPLPPVAAGEPIRAGRMPVGIAVGSGAVWVVDAGSGSLLRIDPRTRRRTGAPIRVGPAPFAVAVGEGAVWVASLSGAVRGYDPRTSAPVGRPVTVPEANGLAVGRGGVWVTSRVAGTVTRVDPRTGATDRPVRVGAGAADVVVTSDGAVWVANASDGSVSRVAPGADRADPPVRVGGQVLALAAGDGALWVARARGEFAQQVEVVRLDLERRELTGTPLAVGGAIPLDLAASDGVVWATDVGGLRPPEPDRPGSVTRIDARGRLRADAPLPTGDRPGAVAVGAGATWVANAADGTVTPVHPAR